MSLIAFLRLALICQIEMKFGLVKYDEMKWNESKLSHIVYKWSLILPLVHHKIAVFHHLCDFIHSTWQPAPSKKNGLSRSGSYASYATSVFPNVLFQMKKLISPTFPFVSKTTQAFLFTIRVYSLLKNTCPFLTILKTLQLSGPHSCKTSSIKCPGNPESFFAAPAIWQSLACLRFFNLWNNIKTITSKNVQVV